MTTERLHSLGGSPVSVLLVLFPSTSYGQSDYCVTGGDSFSSQTEFSGIIVRTVNGKPDGYFDAPPGYTKRVGAAGPRRQG